MIDCRDCNGTGKVDDNTYWRCDTAVAFGKGHQSIAECTTEGPHECHYARDYDIEWVEEDISDKTYTRRRDGKVFRLAFSDVGWFQ